MIHSEDVVLIFGGYGLVGMQIARSIALHQLPKKMVIASLLKHEAEAAIEELRQEFPTLDLAACYGNVFVREEYAYLNRPELLSDPQRIRQLYKDTFGDLNSQDDNILQQCLLTKIIRQHRPTVIVDAINTATGISYQDIKTTSHRVYRFHERAHETLSQLDSELLGQARSGDEAAIQKLISSVESLKNQYENQLGIESAKDAAFNNTQQIYVQLVSQIVPQLVRHVVLLYKVCREVQTRLYLKIGTTGTGGMGLNIPYTHGEDRPSFKLLAKSSVGFAHSGLLFLLARTPGPTIFKEIKPAALIGYRKVDVRKIRRFGQFVQISQPREENLNQLEQLDTSDPESFTSEYELALPGVDTGENGFFTRGEFEAITYLGQMEFVTPQEIAEIALHELNGRNTGKDVVQGVAGAVLDPSYRGGFLRPIALQGLKDLEQETNIPSVAIGQLGPPQLSKLLFEIFLLSQVHTLISDWNKDQRDDREIADLLANSLTESGLDKTITSLGIPIRLPDGNAFLRGANITIPESVERFVELSSTTESESWTQQGWVDLRPENISTWRRRFAAAEESRIKTRREGSAQFERATYPYDEIRHGEMVGWIFNHEPLLGEDSVGGRLW